MYPLLSEPLSDQLNCSLPLVSIPSPLASLKRKPSFVCSKRK